ncbi:hypothetical protein C8R44DRAFT_811060 [Mycena epipterygia]|nr:hypothetical protein C8R44DRAFT_811060 [Mycena epipterygia]
MTTCVPHPRGTMTSPSTCPKTTMQSTEDGAALMKSRPRPPMHKKTGHTIVELRLGARASSGSASKRP